MTLGEFLEKDDRKAMEAMVLWIVKEKFGEHSWIYRAYRDKIDRVTTSDLKILIECQASDVLIGKDLNVVLNSLD